MKMERVHDCLDGKISRSELTEEELEALERLEAVVDETLVFAREASTPDVRDAVMRRIAEVEAGPVPESGGPASWIRGVVAWIWAPRTVQVRPAWAVAGVAILALAVGTLLPGSSSVPAVGPAGDAAGTSASASDDSPTSAPTAPGDVDEARSDEPTVYVRFELDARGASSVRLAGNFTGWDPAYELAEIRPGEWSALVPLEPGVHDYVFVVDGERWVADPDAIQVDDGFGGTNSRIALVAPDEGRDVQS
ncbi:MAG: glycogen-binding domain-containing protein [Longimicrobiales bacterium]